MKVLIVHQNFPGQYLQLARHLGAQGRHQVVFITQRQEGSLPGVTKAIYKPRRGISAQTHHYLRDAEAAVLNAQEVARVAMDLKNAGFNPDVMLGHNGWGEIWYLKDIFPDVPLLGYFEFFYRMQGADVGFDPTDPVTPDTAPRLRTKNLGNLLALDTCDFGQTPTNWQKSVYPPRYHRNMHVIHEGIDTRIAIPNSQARVKVTKDGPEIAAGDEIVTYVSRSLEPYRGFRTFMRSLPAILAARPNARVLIVGADGVSYGAPAAGPLGYREQMLEELGDSLDLSRVHFLGKVSYEAFIRLLQVSRVHVYLTYPFVLSWSMLEAMSAGCLVVGSSTQPVQEAIQHGGNGLLVDFFSHAAVAQRVIEALEDRRAHDSIRQNARQSIIDQYDLQTVCLPAHLRMLATISGVQDVAISSARASTKAA